VAVKCFYGDGEEGMGEFGGVEAVPEEGVVLVGADGCGDAGVGDAGEA